MAKPKFDFDLIVIGSGAGGSACATIAARAGKKVAIVEDDTFGGHSPNWGDIPTKSMLHAAHLYDQARLGARFGIRSNALGFNFLSLRNWKDTAVKRTGAGGNRNYYESEGITTIFGTAHFLTPHEINVNRRHYSAAHYVIATGSEWTLPDIQGADTTPPITPRELMQVNKLPKSVYIIGGGVAGVELAQLLCILGTKVTLAEPGPRLLPEYDREAGELMEKILTKQKGVTVLTGARTVALARENIARRVTYSRGGHEHSLRVDQVMACTERIANIDLGLENAGVAYTEDGIVVNEHLQTTARHIYAAGDVTGQFAGHTHVALLQSRIAANNILSKNKVSPSYSAVPRVAFTHPAIASVGLSEQDCTAQKIKYRSAMTPLSIVSRSNVSDFHEGFVKIIADKKGVVIGATIMAPEAGELIHELTLAVSCGLTTSQVAATQHAFLTWSEAIRITASKLS
jgi:dihydrolipoamide dehydrogenase